LNNSLTITTSIISTCCVTHCIVQ